MINDGVALVNQLSILLKSYWNSFKNSLIHLFLCSFNSSKVLLELELVPISLITYATRSFNSSKVLLEHEFVLPKLGPFVQLSILLKSYWNTHTWKTSFQRQRGSLTLSILLKSYWNTELEKVAPPTYQAFNSSKVLLEPH